MIKQHLGTLLARTFEMASQPPARLVLVDQTMEISIEFKEEKVAQAAAKQLGLDGPIVPVWSCPDDKMMSLAALPPFVQLNCLGNVTALTSVLAADAKPVLVWLLAQLVDTGLFVAYLHLVVLYKGDYVDVTPDWTYPKERTKLAMVLVQDNRIGGFSAREFCYLRLMLSRAPGTGASIMFGKKYPMALKPLRDCDPNRHMIGLPDSKPEDIVFVGLPPPATFEPPPTFRCATDLHSHFKEVDIAKAVCIDKDRSGDGHLRMVFPLSVAAPMLDPIVRPVKGMLCSVCGSRRPDDSYIGYSCANKKRTASTRKCLTCTDPN